MVKSMVKIWSVGRNQPYNEEQKDEKSPIINNTTDTSTNRIRDIEAGVDLAGIEVIPAQQEHRKYIRIL